MGNKGFTLVELLVVIALLGVLSTITIAGIIEVLNGSKNGEYKILEDNIKTAGKMYYEDCSYGTLKGTTGLECTGDISISYLVSYGFLTATEDGNIINPKTNKIINDCTINIEKAKDTVDVTITIKENDFSTCEKEVTNDK